MEEEFRSLGQSIIIITVIISGDRQTHNTETHSPSLSASSTNVVAINTVSMIIPFLHAAHPFRFQYRSRLFCFLKVCFVFRIFAVHHTNLPFIYFVGRRRATEGDRKWWTVPVPLFVPKKLILETETGHINSNNNHIFITLGLWRSCRLKERRKETHAVQLHTLLDCRDKHLPTYL